MEKEWKITLKVLKMSGKLMAVGCWFPPKFPNSGTLQMFTYTAEFGMIYTIMPFVRKVVNNLNRSNFAH